MNFMTFTSQNIVFYTNKQWRYGKGYTAYHTLFLKE